MRLGVSEPRFWRLNAAIIREAWPERSVREHKKSDGIDERQESILPMKREVDPGVLETRIIHKTEPNRVVDVQTTRRKSASMTTP